MKTILIALICIIGMILTGCAQVIVEDIPFEDGSVCMRVKINTFMKSYEIGDFLSRSQAFRGKLTVVPVPSVEIETE
jgi:hypothetical protein